MAMNPRLLRPTASGFNPASIFGLANWWDANDAATVTLNSGAVETWTSKAGLKSAATQTTANNRPVTTTVNGKTALLFDGTNDGLDFTGTARTDETWICAVAQTADQSGQRSFLSDAGDGLGMSATKGAAKFLEACFGSFTEGVGRLRPVYAVSPSALLGPAVCSVVRSAASGGFVFIDGTARISGVNSEASFTTSASVTIKRIGYYSSTLFQFQGWIGEILCYSRALTSAERNAVELYLGRKWGIAVTQVPSVSNADAQDWVNRVYAAGSTVSQPVANAVNAFVAGCQADGIWDAMKSVVLLAGADTLAGALVPLKGAAPTNNGPFVAGDYDRRTGLVGNGSTKWLDTGRNNNADPQDNKHFSVYRSVAATNDSGLIGSNDTGTGHSHIYSGFGAFYFRHNTATADTQALSINTGAVFLGASRSSSSSYGYRIGANNYTATVASQTPANANFRVFETAGRTNARLAFYSIGESLDLALLRTRVDALIAAIQAAI